MKNVIKTLVVIMTLICLVACSKDKPSYLGAIREFEIKDTLEEVENKQVKVILLYGQSNATGVSQNIYLEQNDDVTFSKASEGYDNVLINYITENGSNSSNGEFVKVKLGQGASQNHFGPEIGIADELSKKYSQETIFIIKYSWGGSMLHNQWLNGKSGRGELYEAAINFTLSSLDYLKSKGYLPEIKAIFWMQGESDATAKNYSKHYYDNSKKLIEYFRKDLKKYYKDSLMFVDAGIAEIDIWPEHNDVNKAKEKLASKNDYNKYFSTSSMGLTTNLEPVEGPDLAHYDSISMIKLGQKFASYIE